MADTRTPSTPGMPLPSIAARASRWRRYGSTAAILPPYNVNFSILSAHAGCACTQRLSRMAMAQYGNLHAFVSSGAPSWSGSMPTNRHIAAERFIGVVRPD